MRETKCELCGKTIHSERLHILPETTTCIKCSQIKPYSKEEAFRPTLFQEQDFEAIDIEDYKMDTPNG